jgi:hypothetical protein
MILAEVAQVAQTLSTAAVFSSLIFVGIQIRQNTKTTKATSHHAVSQALNEINLLWARNGEMARLWLAGMEDRSSLTPEERWRFDSTVRAYLHVCETMYTQAGLGAGDIGVLIAEENGIKAIFLSDGVKACWAENLFGFSPAFRNYIEKLNRT